jgi:hypothetical protein
MKRELLQKTIRKASLIGIMLVLTIARILAQNFSIKGKLTDEETGEPIGGVNVLIQGTNKGTVTDSTGTFAMSGLENKLYDVAFSSIGYRPIRQTIMAGAEVTSVELAADATELQGVDVYGKRKATPFNIPSIQPIAWAASTSHITSASIENIGATNLASALKYTVSGYVGEQGRKHKEFFTIRGQMQNADFAVNGISMYQFLDAPSALSSSIIQEIEITRSSNALFLGYSGLNGVANIKTKVYDKFETVAEADYGTFNTIHFNITHGGKVGKLRYALSLSNDRTDGPKNRNAAENMWNFYGSLNYSFKKWLVLDVQRFDMRGKREFAQMVSGKYTIAPNNLAQIWKYDPLTLTLTTAKAKIIESSWALTEIQYYYIDNQRSFHNRSYYVLKAKGVQTLTDSIPPYSIIKEPDYINGGALIQVIKPFESNTLRCGGLYSNASLGTNGVSKKSTVSGIITDEQTFGNLSLDAGVKVLRDYFKDYAPGTVKIKDQWQPAYLNFSFGASYKINSNLILNYVLNGGTVKAPDGSLQLVDNVQQIVKDERRICMDLGIVKRVENLGDVTMTGFFSKRRNAFTYTGVLYKDNDSIQREYLANKDYRTFGIEFAYQSPSFFNCLSGFVNIMEQFTIDLTNIPKVHYMGQPEFIPSAGISFKKAGVTFNIMGRYVSRYVMNRFVVLADGQNAYVGDYTNIDLNAGYAIPKTPLNIYAKVVNIGDVHYTSMSPAFPDYGRRITIGLRAIFK